MSLLKSHWWKKVCWPVEQIKGFILVWATEWRRRDGGYGDKHIKSAPVLTNQIGQLLITYQLTPNDPPEWVYECANEPQRLFFVFLFCFFILPVCMDAYLHESSERFLSWQWSKADWKSDCGLAKNGILVSWVGVGAGGGGGSDPAVCWHCVCQQHVQVGGRCLYITHTMSVAIYVPQAWSWQGCFPPTVNMCPELLHRCCIEQQHIKHNARLHKASLKFPPLIEYSTAMKSGD